MQTRPVIHVYQLNIPRGEQTISAKSDDGLNFYFKTRDEAEHYLAAMFPNEIASSITEELAIPHDDEWMLLEKTDDFRGGFPKTATWYKNNLAELRNLDLIKTITSNIDCVIPVCLINKPAQHQLGGWWAMFGSFWHQSQEDDLSTNKELIQSAWGVGNDCPLMLYVTNNEESDFFRLITVKPVSTTFKLSSYHFDDAISSRIKILDTEIAKLASRREFEISQLAARFDAESLDLAAKRQALVTKDHKLFAERHQHEVMKASAYNKSKFG